MKAITRNPHYTSGWGNFERDTICCCWSGNWSLCWACGDGHHQGFESYSRGGADGHFESRIGEWAGSHCRSFSRSGHWSMTTRWIPSIMTATETTQAETEVEDEIIRELKELLDKNDDIQ
jgi:hypothetical protein